MLSEDFNSSVTENGAVGYRTSGNELVDLNFAVSSLRSLPDWEVCRRFARAYYADELNAVKWLFYAGDVRGGMGERRLFRLGMRFLAEFEQDVAKKLLPLVPEYTRWDNLAYLADSSVGDQAVKIIAEQLERDEEAAKRGEGVSLCAKWLPSVNASSLSTRALARIICTKLGKTAKEYRKTLCALRARSEVLEIKMSQGKWSEVEYEKVPSRANLLYRGAFLRHDRERREDYLYKLQTGETKINAGVLFPHDIVHAYTDDGWGSQIKALDPALEEMWKALPDYVASESGTLCVADGSGSMTMPLKKTQITALEVANALAIYFAERCSGQFKNKYITFSEHPEFVDFSRRRSLRSKLALALTHCECANTDIEAVFDLILATAVKHGMRKENMPKTVLILSDMEFDSCAISSEFAGLDLAHGRGVDAKLFETIANKYRDHGYDLPRLAFWNICSRTGTIPVKENDCGVVLVSGFSPSVMNMVLSDKLDPAECLYERLDSERYAPVSKALGAK